LEFKESLKSFKSPSPILDSILKLNGGSDDLNGKEMEKLVKSVVAKTDQSLDKEISINKFLEKILKLIDPVIPDQRFWRLISELEKPIKSELSGPSDVRSTDILGPAQNAPDKQAKTRSKGSSIFADALSTLQARRKFSSLPPMEKSRLTMAQTSNEDCLSNGLTPLGLSKNHEELSENIQFIEIKTRLRRAQPLYPSEVFGDSYEGKSLEEMAIEYKDLVETILGKSDLVMRKDGTLNKQEPTINMEDPEILRIVTFENNPLYDKHRFITSYPISEEAFETYEKTGNIGRSPSERAQEIDELQRTQALLEREASNARSFLKSRL
jgi:hypothetical protein